MSVAGEKCFWMKDPESGDMHYIPMCMGGAVSGPDGCTCCVTLSAAETKWQERYRATEKKLRRADAHIRWARSELRKAGLREFPLVGEI